VLAPSAVRRLIGPDAPGALERSLERRQIGRAVDQQDDARDRHRGDQLLDLEDAALVRRGEAAQVHQHRRGVPREPRHGHAPAVVVAEEVVDAEQASGSGLALLATSRLSRSARSLMKARLSRPSGKSKNSCGSIVP
jgi:hypothetical protein